MPPQVFCNLDQTTIRKIQQGVKLMINEVTAIPLYEGDTIRFKVEIDIGTKSDRPHGIANAPKTRKARRRMPHAR